MSVSITRRSFIGTSAAAVAVSPFLPAFGNEFAKLKKAKIGSIPDDKVCEKLKEAGFDGIEVTKWDTKPQDAETARKLVEKHGLRIHSVMRAWTNLNRPSYKDNVESVKTALRAAAAFGADSVLWVPCKIGAFPNDAKGKPDSPVMPAAWEFDIDFDPKTLQVKTVVSGDNATYTEYIRLQNEATATTIKAVSELAPVAELLKVKLGIENVWNNCWTTPKFFAALCKQNSSPWVASYFDIGNHTMYAAPQEWIKELGASICKLHIKGFKVKNVLGKLGGGPGAWSKIDQSSIDWIAVRQALADINYTGWISLEETGYSDEKYAGIIDQFIAGTLKNG